MIIDSGDVNEDIEISTDICVLGSGAGGGCIASELSEAGLQVVILEEGPYVYGSQFNSDTLHSIRRLYRDGGTSFIYGNAKIIITEGKCVGGSTVINSGICHRTPVKVLKRWNWEAGIENILPDHMEPYFQKVEERIHVSEEPQEIIGKDSLFLKKGAEALNYKILQNKRNQIACCGCNNCMLGCPSSAKQSTLVSYIPRAIKNGATLFSNCKATTIGNNNGTISYIEGSFSSQNKSARSKIRVKCKNVIIAGGAIQTPLLLLQNRLANSSGMIGKNLYIHPSIKVIAVFDEEIVGWKGSPQSYQVHEFLDEGILLSINFVPPEVLSASLPYFGDRLLEEMRNYNRMMVMGALVEDSHAGSVSMMLSRFPMVSYTLNQQDVRKLLYATALLAEIAFAAGAIKVILPFREVEVLHAQSEIPKIFQATIKPHEFELITFHLMGSCRMGQNPRTSVVNSYGQSHDIQNLFISDTSIFPSPIGINPMVTVQALATRNAEYIINNCM